MSSIEMAAILSRGDELKFYPPGEDPFFIAVVASYNSLNSSPSNIISVTTRVLTVADITGIPTPPTTPPMTPPTSPPPILDVPAPHLTTTASFIIGMVILALVLCIFVGVVVWKVRRTKSRTWKITPIREARLKSAVVEIQNDP